MSINKKIIEYLDFKHISQRVFTNQCGLSEGVLRRGKHIGSGYLKAIKTNYPDLNMNWLLFDEGQMITNSTQSNSDVEDLRYIITLQREKIQHLELEVKALKNKEKTVSKAV